MVFTRKPRVSSLGRTIGGVTSIPLRRMNSLADLEFTIAM
jgi:hypothetical protein